MRTRIACAAAAALLGGCGGPAPVPTAGRLTVGGRPAGGAEVVLYPVGGPWAGPDVVLPRAVVGADGSFRLSGRVPGDGAAPGEYKLAVRWPADPSPAQPGRPAERDQGRDRPDRLDNRYADPRATPWTVTVGPGPTTLGPIDVPARAAR